MRTYKRRYAFILILSFIAGCSLRKKRTTLHTRSQDTQRGPAEPRGITVFVHGTHPPRFLFKIPVINHFCYCPQGLVHVETLEKKYRFRNLQVLCDADPEQFPLETLYLFGWSGDLHFEARYQAAHDLYHALRTLQEKHPGLPITIITHSHGGNVALNLAHIVQEKNDTLLSIERLIVLACPVQKHTAELVHAPLFKTIHALYSPIDVVQVADPQGLYETQKKHNPTLFSQRHFPKNSKLTHCRVRLRGQGIAHNTFLTKDFLKNVPIICKKIEKREKWDKLKHIKTMDEYIIRL